MRQTTFTESGAPGRVIGRTNFSTFHRICLLLILLILVGVELLLCKVVIVVTLS